MEALQRDDVIIDDTGLRPHKVKDEVNSILKRVANNVGSQYGWPEINEIDETITVSYMFEMVKRLFHNKRRKEKYPASWLAISRPLLGTPQ